MYYTPVCGMHACHTCTDIICIHPIIVHVHNYHAMLLNFSTCNLLKEFYGDCSIRSGMYYIPACDMYACYMIVKVKNKVHM